MDKQDMRDRKKKGPIRSEAIVPFAIVIALTGTYFTLFFDGHLRRGIEWAAAQANGAEVNVGVLKTSFLKGTFLLRDLEVTDPSEPAKNRVQIGEIKFNVLWDALLRAKVVIDLAAVHDLQVGSARTKAGYVLPPPAESSVAGYMAKTKDRFTKTALSNAAQLLEGMDPTKNLKDLGELKALTKITGLKSELARKEAEWNQSLSSIPGEKDLASLESRLAAIPTGGVNNPAEAAARISQVKTVLSEAEGKVGSVKSLGDSLVNNVNSFGSSLAEVDELVKADISDLEKKLKIPSLDAKSLAEQLFGESLLTKVGQVERYSAMARQYMPAKGAPQKKEVVQKPPRGKGKTYEFPMARSYPRFWLKKAEISSKGENSAFGGDISGEILDATSNPPLLGRPMVMTLKGDFAKQNLRQIETKLVVDHTGDVPSESLRARIGSYPVTAMNFSDSESFRFGMEKALGAGGIEAVLRGDRVAVTVENTFREISYQVGAKSKLLEATLQSVTREMPKFSVLAKVSGTWDNLGLSIQSSLAGALERGFQKQLQAKVAEARKKLNEMVQAKIMEPKRELSARFTGAKGKLIAQVDGRRKQGEALQGQARARLTSLTNQASSLQNKAQDLIKKKLPF